MFLEEPKPIPVLDQSVAKHVGFDLSKILTPFSISLVMVNLEAWKAFSRSVVHSNLDPDFNSARNGFIFSAMLNAYATWFTRPNQERMSVKLVGVGKPEIARKYLSPGQTSVMVILKPANSTSSDANVNLLGFRMMPLRPQSSRYCEVCEKLFSISLAHRRVSSTHLTLSLTSAVIASYRLVYASPDAM
ncbi:unnamed protein product [Meganyctiphanes norvegica]|uniref:Uncharacterized protein n=1 Tax=Meganyctiphanes norvegica TaxID=48144 RepID=A0AAV2R9H8_MEGNR